MHLKYEKKLWKGGYNFIAGIDEAGRGPLAGPVVAAAVIFPHDFLLADVNDSKQLTSKKREILYKQIIENCITFGIGIVSETLIDEINILNATLLAMKSSIDQLKIRPDHLLIDGNRFYDSPIPSKTIIKGDEKCFTIASASIIAKVFRDFVMTEYHNQYPEYNFARHKGYGTVEHIDLLRKNGPCEIHRKSFIVKSLM